eukprot:TRINITY_DN28978_c0_g1_i1.p1 TRINITY_DN28978_c0_g1~~TRINITY_DN28978_c0_g1_i1.p1  ORF type:complete len:317 (-),score=28.01 TRINITY_DN28978_c0_g1_i1:566-1516(-)
MRPVGSSIRDRTDEFSNLVERFQSQQATNGSKNHNGSVQVSSNGDVHKTGIPTKQQQSEFAKKAAQIGFGIHRVSEKLQQLTRLARKTSLFDDPTQEIQQLTGMIKQDIQVLNKQLVELQSLQSTSGQLNSKQSMSHSESVVTSLRTKLKSEAQRFQGVLEMRKETLQSDNHRRKLYSNAPEISLGNPLGGTSLMGDSQGNNASEEDSLLPVSVQQQEQMEGQDAYLSSRGVALRQVESTITELGTIFNQLATMVQQQGELAVRIDENIENAVVNVEGAQAQLLRYLNSISSNRWLIIKIFLVLMIFAAIFVLFFA